MDAHVTSPSTDERQGDSELRMAGRPLQVVVVGPAGEGKSTLINSLICQQKCGRSVYPPTREPTVRVRKTSISLRGSAGHQDTLFLWDADGLTGSKADDRSLEEELRSIEKPDLILACFSFASNSGRYLAMLHGAILRKIGEIWGARIIDKTVIVLTKSDTASDVFQKQAEGNGPSTSETRRRGTDLFWEDLDMWKRELREDQRDGFGTRPVCVAGRLDFSVTGVGQAVPNSLTFVGGKKTWHYHMCDTIETVNQAIAAVFRAAFHSALENYPNFKRSFQEDFDRDPNEVRDRLLKAAAAAALGIIAYFYLPESSRDYAAFASFAGVCYFVYPLVKKAFEGVQNAGNVHSNSELV